MIDLQEYLEFPAPGSGRTMPMVSINEKGLLTRNRGVPGGDRGRGGISRVHTQNRLADPSVPPGEPNLCFRKSGARNKELARQLRGQGYSFPVRYDFQWDQESRPGWAPAGRWENLRPCPRKRQSGGERREETVMKKRQLSGGSRRWWRRPSPGCAGTRGPGRKMRTPARWPGGDLVRVGGGSWQFSGKRWRGWERAYRLAGQAVREELGHRQRQRYGEVSLDAPVRGDAETTLLQLLHSPPAAVRAACVCGTISADSTRTCSAPPGPCWRGRHRGSSEPAASGASDAPAGALRTLREAMEEYLRIQ